MTEELKKALILWAQRIIQEQEDWDAQKLHSTLQKLYEISICNQMVSRFPSSSNEVWKRQQTQLNEVLEQLAPTEPKETNDENLEVPPMIEAIKNMVVEMPEQKEYDTLFETATETPIFVAKADPILGEKEGPAAAGTTTPKKNLNDQFAKIVSIDLNDRLAFVKHLFENNTSDYERVLSQLSTFATWEEAQNFIHQQVKSEYSHWDEKPELEARFIAVLQKHYDE